MAQSVYITANHLECGSVVSCDHRVTVTWPLCDLQGGHNEWLMVDKHLVDLTGRTCNKLGVSFTGFRYQRNGCRQQRQS